VDALLIRRRAAVTEVGLIQRHNPFGPEPMWCHIGGRVRRNEILTAALRRHLDDSIDNVEVPLVGDVQPVYVMEWLTGGPTDDAPWAGTDPRKHAISLCYAIPVAEDLMCRPGGEALYFRWFEPAELDDLDGVWPGTKHLVNAVLSRASFDS